MGMSVLCVCLSASISPKLKVRSSHQFLLPVAVARSTSGGVAIRHVLPVLWMMSCSQIMARIGDAKRRILKSSQQGTA